MFYYNLKLLSNASSLISYNTNNNNKKSKNKSNELLNKSFNSNGSSRKHKNRKRKRAANTSRHREIYAKILKGKEERKQKREQ